MTLPLPSALSTLSALPAACPMSKSGLHQVTKNANGNGAATSSKAAENKAKPSRRGKLGPGCSLIDWIRLCRSKKDLGCNGGKPKPVTEEELAQHNSPSDAWTAIRGKVYNMTPYMKFHPGGVDELMRGAGKDCTILFDEVHKWVKVESMMKACFVGPLVTSGTSLTSGSSTSSNSSSTTQNTNTTTSTTTATPRPARVNSLSVPKPIMIVDGINKEAVPRRKTSMDIRNEAAAAGASEEVDGGRQVSPDSPSKPLVPETPITKIVVEEKQGADDQTVSLTVPNIRTRKNSDVTKPNPRFDWVESERAMIIHVSTHCQTLKKSDVVLDVNGTNFEAAVFINDWVYELKIELLYPIAGSQVQINAGRVDISLKKEDPHKQWENIGTLLAGHGVSTAKSRRVPKYHRCCVENISSITHDSRVYSLRLPAGSYLNVPTGHHLAIRADVDGEEVERSYTPVCSLTDTGVHRHPLPASAAGTTEPSTEGEALDLLIKLYPDGKMSRYLAALKKGDEVWVSDPEGTFDATTKLSQATDFLLLAAGTGFTPMVKVVRDALSSELASREQSLSSSSSGGAASASQERRDHQQPAGAGKTAKLLFANKTEKDILWKEELLQFSKATQGRFEAVHVLSEADESWDGLRGRISETLIKTHLSAPLANSSSSPQSRRTLVCICGPTGFTAAMSNYLMDMDYPTDLIHCFQ